MIATLDEPVIVLGGLNVLGSIVHLVQTSGKNPNKKLI